MFGTSTWLGWGLAAGLFVGMVGSLGQGLFAFARYIRPVNSLEVSFSNLTDVVVGLTDGLLLGLTFGLLSSGVFGVVLGSVAGIGRIIEYGLFVGLVTGVFAGLALARREKLTASKGPPREIVRVVLTLALLLGAMTWYFAPGGAQGALSALAFEGSTRFALAVALGLLTGTAGWVLLRTTAEEAEKEVSDDEGDGRAARGGEGRFSTPRVRPP